LGAATNADKGGTGLSLKQQTCAQRIEAATVQKTQVVLTEMQSWDAEALFRKYDYEKTQLLSRGALTDLLCEIGLDEKLGSSFSATARLAFDSHSADAHFLALAEFKQLYHHISTWHPGLLPRETSLSITILGARDLPSTDANGKSDPFCTVQCCRQDASGKVELKPWSKSQTKVVEKTLTPWWGEDFTDKYGYEEGDHLVFHVYDWDKGEKSELICKAILPVAEFHRPGGFHSNLPLTLCVTDIPKGLAPVLYLRVVVNGLPVPPPRLQVHIRGAVQLPPPDMTGKADLSCMFQIVGKPYSKSTTKVCMKTLEPVWNEHFDGKYRYEDGDELIFEVRYHDGKNSKPELLGRCVLPPHEFAKMGGFSGAVPLTDVIRPAMPAEGGRGYAPALNLTAYLTDMMPAETPATTPSAAGPAGGDTPANAAAGEVGAAEGAGPAGA